MVMTVTLEPNQPDCLATTATKDLLLLPLLSLHDSEGINLLVQPTASNNLCYLLFGTSYHSLQYAVHWYAIMDSWCVQQSDLFPQGADIALRPKASGKAGTKRKTNLTAAWNNGSIFVLLHHQLEFNESTWSYLDYRLMKTVVDNLKFHSVTPK